jgi:hypothetical protein
MHRLHLSPKREEDVRLVTFVGSAATHYVCHVTIDELPPRSAVLKSKPATNRNLLFGNSEPEITPLDCLKGELSQPYRICFIFRQSNDVNISVTTHKLATNHSQTHTYALAANE